MSALTSDEYTCVVGLISLMDLDPLLIAVLTDAYNRSFDYRRGSKRPLT